jgi:uncharacterized protein YdeI (YjbR/CyaY-like superfamily)
MKGDRWEDPRHFRTPAACRAWLEKNHDRVSELWIGFHRKGTGGKGVTYKEALDEALCFGWIDGIKRKVDDTRYTNRFTPRKRASKWSEVNLRRYTELEEEGRIAPPGADARARFDPKKHGPYSFERRIAELAPKYTRAFQRKKTAWAFFQDQPPGYRRSAIHWVMSAKREETRERRLTQLMDTSREGRRLPQIAGQPARGP